VKARSEERPRQRNGAQPRPIRHAGGSRSERPIKEDRRLDEPERVVPDVMARAVSERRVSTERVAWADGQDDRARRRERREQDQRRGAAEAFPALFPLPADRLHPIVMPARRVPGCAAG